MLNIREVKVGDEEIILHFINELAIFEKAEDKVEATVEGINESIFGEKAIANGFIAEWNNKPAGFAIYFYNFSTWKGRKGLYLEDLYVSPEYRGRGIGKELLNRLGKKAVEENCGRFEWVVLDWNKKAIDVYESIGAKAQNEWIIYRLDSQKLEKFGEK